MYLNAFGFREAPFGVTPDPRFFYLGRTHDQALSSLCYGIEHRKGFVMVTGEVGTGKTLLCRSLLQRLDPGTHTALVLNPRLGPLDLLRVIAADLCCGEPADGKVAVLDALSRFLLAEVGRGRNAVIVIDEAQTLPDESLEEIRLLSNLETSREKLLQIVLVGQPELLAKLSTPHLRQVSQRINVRIGLGPLEPREIRLYVAHRLRVASGRERPDLFSPAALQGISRLSRGNPRDINALCDRALLAAYAAGRNRVGLRLVWRAYRDLGITPARRLRLFRAALAWSLLSLLLAAAAWLAHQHRQPDGRLPEPPSAITREAPAIPAVPAAAVPAAAAPASAPAVAATTPAQSPPSPEPDQDFSTDSKSLNASLTALARIWKMEQLAADVGQWQFLSLKDRSLPAFFRKSGLAQTHDVEIHALPATERSLRAVDLPCLASEKTGEGYRFVVLAGLRKSVATVLDPVSGGRSLPVEEWLAKVRGSLYCLLPKSALAPALRPGDRGPEVLSLQRDLRRAGFLRSAPGGTFGRETRDAVLALQRKHGLREDGVAGLETRLRLRRQVKPATPSLREPL